MSKYLRILLMLVSIVIETVAGAVLGSLVMNTMYERSLKRSHGCCDGWEGMEAIFWSGVIG